MLIIEENDYTALTDTSETIVVQEMALALGRKPLQDYTIALADCLKHIGMSRDFFHLCSLITLLKPCYQFQKEVLINAEETLPYYGMLHKMRQYRRNFNLKFLGWQEIEWLYNRLSDADISSTIFYDDESHWSRYDWQRMKLIVEAFCDDPF